MMPALFAQAPTADEIEKLQNDVKELNDLSVALGLAFFLLLGWAVLLAVWAAGRRWRPAAPGEQRVPLAFVAWLFGGLIALPAAWWGVLRGWGRLSDVQQADLIVIVHLSFVLGVLAAQLLVLAGWALRWEWVSNFWFRLTHLLFIHLVASQAALQVHCPLTSWEWKLRYDDAYTVERASALARWCHQALFSTSDLLLVIYIVFLVAVLVTWVLLPPRWPWAAQSSQVS